MSPTILLLGSRGQLGWELNRTLLPIGPLVALDSPEIDVLQPDTWLPVLRQVRPSVVINATAYTAVDRAESEPDIAMAVNGEAPGMLAEAAQKVGAAFIHYSTDYIFDGQANKPYVESDPPGPLSAYARSKLAGEQAVAAAGGAHIILRTSWLYSLRRESFVTKVLAWARKQPVLHLVTDQVSNPTWARWLAETTAALILRAGQDIPGGLNERRGIYHIANTGFASRLEWGQAILRCDPNSGEQVVRQVLPALTSEFPTPAQRPLYTALNCDRFAETFGLYLLPWEEALQLALKD